MNIENLFFNDIIAIGDYMMTDTNSNNTKYAIEQNFKILVSEKLLSKVSVSEIVNTCKINRKTFYYYYEDIYALLRQTLKQEAINIVARFDFQKEFDDSIKFILDYIEKNNSFLKNVYYSVGRDELKRFFYDDFVFVVEKLFDTKSNTDIIDPEFKSFFIKFYTEAFASTFVDLIVGYPNIDNEKTVQYLIRIINNSFSNIQ